MGTKFIQFYVFLVGFFPALGLAEAQLQYLLKAGNHQIPSLAQFEQYVFQRYPTLSIKSEPIGLIDYRESLRQAHRISVEGEINGYKVIQKTTYIEKAPHFWQLVFVQNKYCQKGQIKNQDQQVVEKWFCEDDAFPIGGFDQLYYVTDENLTPETLQPYFSSPVMKAEAFVEQGESMMTIGDLRQLLSELGTSLVVDKATYTSPFKADEKNVPGYRFLLQGSLSPQKKLRQVFTYVTIGEELHLREIDGVICEFVERIGKEICDPVYQPTPISPLPLKLVNSEELSHKSAPEPFETESPSKFACGNLPNDYSLILKVHFQRSIFDLTDPKEYERFIGNIPHVADPMGLVLSAKEAHQFFLNLKDQADYQSRIHQIIEAFQSGSEGDCEWLFEIGQTLHEKLLTRAAAAKDTLKTWSRQQPLETSLTDDERNLYQALLRALPPDLAQVNEAAAWDIALGRMQEYLGRALDQTSQPEELVLAAMAKQDLYSGLLTDTSSVTSSLYGQNQKLYFGVRVEQGISGHFYFTQVHNKASQQGLALGDQIVQINGESVEGLTYHAVDIPLQDTTKPLNLTLKRGMGSEPQEVRLRLEAQEIDLLEMSFSLSSQTLGDDRVSFLRVNSFEAGMSERLAQRLKSLSEIDGFVIDLRGNPGGNVEEALKFLSLFVKDRVIAHSRIGARHRAAVKTHQPQSEYFFDDQKPMAVLVDQNTQSAAEIVASSLKSLKRGLIVGSRTHGKFVGQSFVPLLDGKSGLLITSFEFFDPMGRSLHGRGLEPDVQTLQTVWIAPQDGVGQGLDLEPGSLPVVEPYQLPPPPQQWWQPHLK